MLYRLGKLFSYCYLHVAFRLRYAGLENIPKDKGFILACNHRSLHDPLFIAHRVPKTVHYMAKAELFQKKPLAWLLRRLQAFPVARGSGDDAPITAAKEALRCGDVLGMFPEGTRSKDGKPLRARSGVSMIAGQTSADVLPCAVCYGEKLRFRTPVTVRYGKLITQEALAIDAEKASSIRAASKRIMADITGLLEQEE